MISNLININFLKMFNNIQERIDFFKKYIERAKLDFKQYQADGLEWILQNELKDDGLKEVGFGVVRGGFVADEMGLGKTILMIGTMLCNFVPPTIIVVPPILVDQWYVQIYKTTGHKSIIYHGDNKKKITLSELEGAKIVITTYGAITLAKKTKKDKNDKNDKNGNVSKNLLHQVKWGRVIFDEAHHLRNAKTTRYRGAKLLQSGIRWLVSGTPVQNSKKDFYSLCSMIGLPASYYTDSANLRHLARSFILKRTKKQVGIEMTFVVLDKNIVDWKNRKEMQLSEEIHSALAFSRVSSKNIGSQILTSLKTTRVLSLLLYARQTCILPKLMMKRLEGLKGAEQFLHSTSKLDSVAASILEKRGNGCGKLVFCHFREEIDEIAARLRAGGMTKVATFDGRTTNKLRYETLNEAHEALILQIQTGCEGLNLQENYSEIYFVSPHWNPAVEDQAIARCHRIGQTKHVFVHRFEMGKFYEQETETMTVDNYVDAIQESKRIIANECIA